MRVNSPVLRPPVPARAVAASSDARVRRPDPVLAVERAYAEITAPRADLSRLIVDTRPGHEHPLLQREAAGLRTQAHLRRPDAARHQRDEAPAAPGVDDERTAPWAPLPAALPPGHPARPAPLAGSSSTIVERSARSLPGPVAHQAPPRPGVEPRRAGAMLGERAVKLRELLARGEIMARGQRGAEVQTLQDLLRRRGLAVTPSGVFDADTLAAVRAVQRRAGLAPTGQADLEVLRALLSALPRRG